MSAHPRKTPPSALTIAGSDSGGGAGIQADLKTFLAYGVHGTSAITAVTAQNTLGVRGVHVLPATFIRSQVESVVSDIDVRATKTGMLATAEIIETVADLASARLLPNLVVDPVMVAASGDRLLDEEAEKAYMEVLFSKALVVTPNLSEAQVLVGQSIDDVGGMEAAAKRIAESGARYVVIKGGHLSGQEAVDVVYTPSGDVEALGSPRISTDNVHGTGCTFAAAIAAGLALGQDPMEAIKRAKAYVSRAIELAADWKIGKGRGPVDHLGASTAHSC